MLGTPQAWRHWYQRALPAYWLFLFCGTHLPGLHVGGGIPGSDKLLHAGAFAALAFFYWQFCASVYGQLSSWFVWKAGVVLGLYAAFDEYTQQFVGRRVDIRDYLCGLAGIVVVLAVLEWRRRVWLARERSCRDTG